MHKKHIDIDQHEADILKDFENGEFVSTSHKNKEMRLAKEAANNFVKRDNRINIRKN